MRQYPIAREGWSFLVILEAITIVVYFIAGWWALLPGFLFLFTAYFFRNPTRHPPHLVNAVLSPADGVITRIEEDYEGRYLQDNCVKISIFLSLFNVHINRSPLDGIVEYIERISGKFVPAYHPHARILNSKNFVGLNTRWGKFLLVQITGIIARRIVCWANVGDEIKQGEHLGLIRFGSCTEIYLPKSVLLEVKKGDKVKAGLTVLGRFID